jgi:hypothetical protein
VEINLDFLRALVSCVSFTGNVAFDDELSELSDILDIDQLDSEAFSNFNEEKLTVNDPDSFMDFVNKLGSNFETIPTE